MVFLSMKIYILGTDFIDAKLDGVAYLIALYAFSLAVIDGPSLVERLFGIDAGLKSSYGALAGAKGASQGLKGLSSAGKSSTLKRIQGVAGAAGMVFGAITNRSMIHDLAEAGMMLYRKRRILEKLERIEIE